MSGFTRRTMLGGLAAAATVGWARSGRAAVRVSAQRVRPGAALTLACAGAEAFELRFGDGSPRLVAARGGRLRVGAPGGWSAETWTPLRIVPLADGRPLGPAAEVLVFTRAPLYGV